MTGRILRIELRRSAAVGIGVLLLVLGAALLLTFPQGFAGRWMQLAVSTRLMLAVTWPLALAGGAWLGRRDARSRVSELFASTVRPRWQRVLPTAGALALTVVTGYALIFVIGSGWVVATSAYFPATAIVVVAVGGVSVVAAAWLGLAAGRAVPRLITAPALAVLGAAVVELLPEWVVSSAYDDNLGRVRPDPAALLLTPVYTGGLDDFQTIAARVNLLQVLWLAALAATGLLLAMVGRRAIVLALLPALVGAAVTVPFMPTGAYDAAAVLDPHAVELVCDDNGPRVCVTRVHAGLLAEVVGPVREALALMAAKLPNAPTRAAETQSVWYWALPNLAPAPTRHQADTLVFDGPSIGSTGHADFEGDYFLPSLLRAAWQQDCGDRREDRAVLLARTLVAAWLTGQPRWPDWWQAEDRARLDSAYRSLVALPAAEQRRRMGEARDAVLDCRTDVLVSILPRDAP